MTSVQQKLSRYTRGHPFKSRGVKIYITPERAVSVSDQKGLVFHGTSNISKAIYDFMKEVDEGTAEAVRGWYEVSENDTHFQNGEWVIKRSSNDNGWYLSNETVPTAVTFFPDNWKDLMEDTIEGVLDAVMRTFETWHAENKQPTGIFSVVEVYETRFTLMSRDDDGAFVWYAADSIGGKSYFTWVELRELGEVEVLYDAS